MKIFNKSIVVLCAIILAFPVRAGGDISESINWSENFSLVSVVVVGISVYSVLAVIFWPLQRSSDIYDNHKQKRRAATKPIPDMEVKTIDEDENGNPQVRLQDANNPAHFIILTWINRKDNPIEELEIGQRIHFQPSPQRSGWLVQDTTGKNYAFIAATDPEVDNHSALF